MQKYFYFFYFIIFIFIKNFATSEEVFTLEQAINEVDKQSANVQKNEITSNTFETQKYLSYFSLGPTLSASYSKTRYSGLLGSNYNIGAPSSSTQSGVEVNQPLSGIVKNLFLIHEKSELSEQAEQNVEQSRIDARLNIAQLFLTASQNKVVYDIVQNKMSLFEKQLKDTDIMFQSGDKTKIDVLQMQSAFLKAKSEVDLAKTNYENALLTLKNALNDSQNKIKNVANLTESYFEKKNISLAPLQDYLSQSTLNRSDLKAQEALVSATKSEKIENVFNFLPEVSLFASASKASSDYNNQTTNYSSNSNKTFAYGLRASWNIWDGGVIASRQSEISARQKNAEIDRFELIKNIQETVTKNYADLKTKMNVLDQAKSVLKTNEEVFKLSLTEYRLGNQNAFDLINVQNELFSARVGVVKLRMDLDLAWLNLQSAAGFLPSVNRI